jgi:hypothetical protein
LFIVNCSFELCAQDSGYFLDTSSGEIRFIQRISWVSVEYASRYEVILEREVGGRYQELRREFTTALFIEVSLAAGKYRCRVIPYDFLNRTGEDSWKSFEVLAAISPELDDALVEFVYSDKDHGSTVYEMNFSARNLVSGADMELRGSNGERIYPFAIYINEDGTGARLSFYKDQLLPGNYELFVKNPGGLEARVTVIVQESAVPELPKQPELAEAPLKKFNLFLTAAWMPSITIYDKGYRFSDDGFSPIGAAIRLGIIFTKPDVINLGVELTEAWSVVYDGSDGRSTHIDSTLNFLMQKRSPGDKTALTFRLGIGFSLPLFDYNGDNPPFTDLLYINSGVSLLVFVWNGLYLEGGIDYAHWFGSQFSGNFRPWLGIGLRF